MKLVFFSADKLEVERLRRELAGAGIPCEVRNGVVVQGISGHNAEVELWVQNDRDCHRAFMLCVERNAGFAKRRARFPETTLWDESQAA